MLYRVTSYDSAAAPPVIGCLISLTLTVNAIEPIRWFGVRNVWGSSSTGTASYAGPKYARTTVSAPEVSTSYAPLGRRLGTTSLLACRLPLELMDEQLYEHPALFANTYGCSQPIATAINSSVASSCMVLSSVSFLRRPSNISCVQKRVRIKPSHTQNAVLSASTIQLSL